MSTKASDYDVDNDSSSSHQHESDDTMNFQRSMCATTMMTIALTMQPAKIRVEKGATIDTTGRFTAYDVDDVEWEVNGAINVKNNVSRGHGRFGSGKSVALTNSRQGWVDGNVTFDPGPHATGNLTSENSILSFGSNPVVLAGGTEATANGNCYGVGGKHASVASYGNRENRFAVWSSDFGAAGAGPEFLFRNSSTGGAVFAAISGKGTTLRPQGLTGGVVVATREDDTAQATPTATAEFDVAGNTILSIRQSGCR